MTELTRERREELRAEVHEMGDTRIVGDMGERVTLGELRALLDMADERDELQRRLSDQFANQYHLAGDLEMAQSVQKNAEQRAQRAEAECERLRQTLPCPACHSTVRNLYACAYSLLKRGATTERMEDMRRAVDRFEPYVTAHFSDRDHSHGEATAAFRNELATPPPESEPEQAHGDALAALYRLSSYTADDYCDSPHARWHDTAAVRQALTASGVPYVPDSVWRNLTKIEQDAPRPFSECACAVKRELASAPAGEVVVTTKDGECVAVTRQDSEGQILSVIWERESAPADGWWKKGDHVEFVTDEITDKGPCTGKIRWVLDGLACIELADDFVHVRWSEIGNFRMARHHRTGWPLWIVGESAAAPQRGGE